MLDNNKKASDEILELADKLCFLLLDHNFVVHRYDSHSTNSIYLKLDYGACGSIRISDHEGFSHLNYRWNIGPHIKNKKTERGRYYRSFYNSRKWPCLIQDVVNERGKRQAVKGSYSYKHRINKGIREMSRDKNGFWSHNDTREVKVEDLRPREYGGSSND